MKHTLLLFFFIISLQSFSQNANQSVGFKENKGQIIDQKGKPNTAVKYLLNTNGLNVQLKKNGFSYDIYEVKKIPIVCSEKSKTLTHKIPEKEKTEQADYTLEYTFHRIDIDFVNANSKVELITSQESKDFDNYYNIPNKPEGIVGVHQYKQITYKNIYPNIDIVFTVPNDSQKTVEYNFVIHPKGKISDIQLKFNGAETDLVDNKIQMNVRFGKMEETLPASWIEDGASKKEIAVSYTKIKKNVYGFSSSSVVSDKTVIIDPVPTRLWGTFYGEGDYNYFTDMSTDNSGNIYITGWTYSYNSTGLYASAGAYQTIANSDSDGIIAKFDSDGKRIWGTWYGGNHFDEINGIVNDSQGNVIIAGITSSSDNISTNNSYQSSLSDLDGNSGLWDDAFLVKFNSSGVRIWGTYFGGESTDSALDVDIDQNDNIYIVGKTNSKKGIAINSNFQTILNQEIIPIQFPPPFDGFLSKFSPTGNLIWSTYVGGEKDDIIETIKIAPNYLILGGGTESFRHISTSGVHLENHYPEEHSNDATVYKFDLNGNRIWGTYYGWKSFSYQGDIVKSVSIDEVNNIYIGGQTDSFDNISTIGSFQELKHDGDGTVGFLSKLNSNGQRIWGTYLGSHTTVNSVIYKNDFLYVGGSGGWKNKPITTKCAYRAEDSREAYWGKFTKDGDLNYGTCAGGGAYFMQQKICVNSDNVIVAGIADSNKGIADSNSYQSSINGKLNFYLIKFSDQTTFNIPIISSNSPICISKTLELKASGGTNYSWTGPNGFSSTDQNPTIPNTTIANSGEYSCLITGTGGCDDTKKVTVVIGDIQAPIPEIVNLPTITGDCNTAITTIPTATDACAGIITGITTNPLSYSLPGTYTIVWNYNDGNGNISHQDQIVTITSQPLPAVNNTQTFCMLQNATLADVVITGQNIKWYDNLTTGILLPKTTLLQNGLIYYASQTINGCESERTQVTVNIQNTLAPIGNINQLFCTGQNPTIVNIQITGNLIKWYDTLNNGSLLTETINLINGKTYYASQTINGCESERFGITVSIVNTPSAPTVNPNQSFCKNENAKLSNIQISGETIKWYDSNTSTILLPNTTLLENNKTYYASQTVGCESDRKPVSIQIYNTPLPTGSNNQQFCIDENATIANLNITGTALKWYDSRTNGSILAQTTLLQNGVYYVEQTLNNCESERLAVNVKIQDTQIPIADSPQTFCIQKNAKISNIDIAGQNIQWFESTSSSVLLPESTLLKNGVTYYASQIINNCESDRIPVAITILEATMGDCINYVEELPFPKFFTPNNDGYNDTWTIDFAYLKPNTGIRIFDRYGKFIKELTVNTAWDGTYIGQDEPASDYWFTVKRVNGTEFRSHFSLKR